MALNNFKCNRLIPLHFKGLMQSTTICVVLTGCVIGDAGESGLHLAVVHNDLAMVRRLVACGADVNQRASGRFFLPEDQKLQQDGVTDYNGLYI